MIQKKQPRLIATFWYVMPTLLVAALVFSSCTALTEAQKRREQRLLEARNART